MLGVGVALALGSTRALSLWRARANVAVVNTGILAALDRQRGGQIENLLRGAGPSPYLRIAEALGTTAHALITHDRHSDVSERALRLQLGRVSARNLALANQRLRRSSWLDALTVAAIALVGFSAALSEAPSAKAALGLVAATLLWLANVSTARSLASSFYSGAEALVDALVDLVLELRGTK